MKKLLSYVLAASLLLYPFAAFAADYGSQSSQTKQAPPVAQPLVREGDFAIKLAAKLDLGLPTNEAVAEDMLAKAGVVPANGWLSDYPVTPEIVGQLHDAITKAAADGKLPMNTDEATKGLYALTAEMNLPTPAGSGSASEEGTTTPAPQSPASPAVINNYYYDEGPPIVTYYPPPYDYVYLYDWVPYPVFWFGFWFPGFYICHDFTSVVVVNQPFVHGVVGRRGIVTNRVIDPVTRRVATVDPVTRTSSGTVRPVTALRAESGRTFMTLSELRKEPGATGARRSIPNSTVRTEGFRSPEARRSAGAIFSRSVQGMRSGPVRQGVATRGGGRTYVSPGTSGRSGSSSPSWGGERRYNAPASRAPERTYRYYQGSGAESSRSFYPSASGSETGRSYSAPARRSYSESGRQFGAPSMPSRSYESIPFTRGGSGPVRGGGFSDGGRWQGRGR